MDATARSENFQAVLIAGPTASGKSELALSVAEAFGGVVINADSMQVYRELRVLTARPSSEDEARAPHRLYGCISASEVYSTGRWLGDVERELAAAREADRLPVIAGGTGLYFKALLEGLSPVPDIPPNVRRHWRVEAARIGAEGIFRDLQERDAAMAQRLNPADTQRITRALEVIDATGHSLAHWQKQSGQPLLDEARCVKIVAELGRDELYQRLDKRFQSMIETGALEEAAALIELCLDEKLPALRAIGVRPLIRFLRGECTLAEAAVEGQAETRRYAKRQMTWVRSNMITWNHKNAQYMERTKREIHKMIRSRLDVPAPHA